MTRKGNLVGVSTPMLWFMLILVQPLWGGDTSSSSGDNVGGVGGGFRPSLSSTCTMFDPANGQVVGRGVQVGNGGGSFSKWEELEAQDTVRLGLFEGIHRFMLIFKDKKGNMAGEQGTLGLAYSTQPGTASILRTLSDPLGARAAWGIIQPPNFNLLQPVIFSVVASEDSGELQIGGFDPAAALTPVHYSRIHNSSGQRPYSIRVKGMRYGDREILFFGDGGKHSIEASFDTGSDCVMVPDRQFGALKASPFRSLLEAHIKHGQQTLTFVLSDERGGELTLSLPYKSWTHPGGCLGPYKGRNIVFGVPVFREYLVVHDLSHPDYRVGIAPLNPQYSMGAGAQEWNYGGDSSVLEEDSGGYLAGKKLLKLRLSTNGGHPARRYMVQVGIGTPAQRLRLVLDTGSYQVDILRWQPSTFTESTAKKKHISDADRKAEAVQKLKQKSLAAKKGAGQTKKEGDEKSTRTKHEEHKKQAALQRLKTKPRAAGTTAAASHGGVGSSHGTHHDTGGVGSSHGTHHDTERGRGEGVGSEDGAGSGKGLTDTQIAFLAMFGILVGVLLVVEVHKQRMISTKRFRLVEYSHSLPGGSSRIEFTDYD